MLSIDRANIKGLRNGNTKFLPLEGYYSEFIITGVAKMQK
jgi:hypothetical protein